MKEGIGMLFKKKTLDEKMEKYVKHHDWYAIQEVITGSKEEKMHLLLLCTERERLMALLLSSGKRS